MHIYAHIYTYVHIYLHTCWKRCCNLLTLRVRACSRSRARACMHALRSTGRVHALMRTLVTLSPQHAHSLSSAWHRRARALPLSRAPVRAISRAPSRGPSLALSLARARSLSIPLNPSRSSSLPFLHIGTYRYRKMHLPALVTALSPYPPQSLSIPLNAPHSPSLPPSQGKAW